MLSSASGKDSSKVIFSNALALRYRFDECLAFRWNDLLTAKDVSAPVFFGKMIGEIPKLPKGLVPQPSTEIFICPLSGSPSGIRSQGDSIIGFSSFGLTTHREAVNVVVAKLS